MLDTELKIDQFLLDLKVELLKGKMKEGNYGADVEISMDGAKMMEADESMSKIITPIFKSITVKILVKDSEIPVKLR